MLSAPASRPFQIDLVKAADSLMLGPAPLAELVRAVELLHRIAPSRTNDPLRDFRAAFVARYGTREERLIDVLDEEAGIGFEHSDSPAANPAPLLAGLRFPSPSPESARFTTWHAHLLQRLGAAGAIRELCLDEDDVAAMTQPDRLPLPDAVQVRATLAAASAAALDAGDFVLYLLGVSGPSGVNLLGRFCHGDPRLTAAVRRHLRSEENQHPEALFAEIVHLPEGRLANLLSRPTLRDYEIPFLGRSGLPPERRIAVDDLMISIENDRVRLRSSRLDREVVPRLTTAHNFATRKSIGLYRFLCALQHQGLATPTFHWGPLAHAPMLPRVRHGRVILSLARWRLDARQLASIDSGDASARFAAVQQLRRTLGLPRRVSLVESDLVLPADLDNALSVESLAHLIRKRTFAVLVETFPAREELCVSDPAGRFTHEIVLPLHLSPPPAAPPPRPGRATLRRRFAPGSEWLSLKIYPAGNLERVLCDTLAPMIDDVRGRGVARWFFVRYADPDWHVRLRFQGVPAQLHAEILPRATSALEPLLASGMVWRVQLDTYEREVERYGGDSAMRFCEEIFHADSDAVLALLRAHPDDQSRWQLTLRGMALLLDDLALSLAQKLALIERARDSFLAEFRGDVPLARSIGARHRELHARIGDALATPVGAPALGPGASILADRSARIATLRGSPVWPPEVATRLGIAGSLLHMHANRMLSAPARAQELVLYDFLARHYRTQRSRS